MAQSNYYEGGAAKEMEKLINPQQHQVHAVNTSSPQQYSPSANIGVYSPTEMQPTNAPAMADGGLLQEGGSVDPESGNEVPVGSMKEEVRDDIPAQLSEGEFVFPADVVRYIGLERLMQMRQAAKEGLRKMDAMGQMGNADEATMEDDGEFESQIDEIMEGLGGEEDTQEMAEGGMPMPVNAPPAAPAAPAAPVSQPEMAAPAPEAAQTDAMMAQEPAKRPSQIIQEALAKDGSTDGDKERLKAIMRDVATNRAFLAQQNNTVFVGATIKPGEIALITYSTDDPEKYQDAVTKFTNTLTEAKITAVNAAASSPEVVTALKSAGAEGLLVGA